MTIESELQIDAMGLETSSGTVVLTISDHLDWTDASNHLQVLERKVNAYLSFIESGQLFEQIADAQGRPLRIAVYQQFSEPPEVTAILDGLARQLSSVGIEFWHGLLPSGY
ncbi:MAG: DUF6572 domain-containing protein [Caulobacteraceae bacterium]